MGATQQRIFKMDWELGLITLYLEISDHYEQNLWVSCQRFTNGGIKRCSDAEVLTVYVFGILRGFRTIKSLHGYALSHLKPYFPGLPRYAAFVHRVNKLSEACRYFLEIIQSNRVFNDDEGVYLVDSFPIVLAKGQHAYTATVASEIASKSYNSTKKMYYYGVKAHVVARSRAKGLPELELLVLDGAGRQDGPVFDQLRLMMHNNLVFADKAYKRPDEKRIEIEQDLKVITPTIKERGQKKLLPEQAVLSKAVAKIRQPIETLFGWINKKTGIQDAGLVRSTAGLVSHIFGRFLAALLSRIYPCLDF